MKKILGGFAIAALLVPLVSFAAEFRVGNQPGTNSGERITDDLYMAGGTVTSAGSVTGDVVAGGGNVVISGEVSGDVIAGGGNVTILSNVADDVRAGGGNVVVQGKVGGDAVIGGGQITLGGPGIGGDVAIGGGVIRVDAPVSGDVKIGGGDVYLNSTITGNIQLEAEKVTLGSKAVINGTLSYKASKELTREEGAVTNGQVTFTPRETKAVAAGVAAALVSVWVVGKFLALFVCALIMSLLLRRWSTELVSRAVERPFLELGRGLIVFAAMPVISVLLLVTILGIPFGIIGLIGYVAVLMFAWIMTPIVVGSVIYQYFSKKWEVNWKTILLGAFAYSILGVIPFVGWAVQLALMLIVLGAHAALKLEIARHWR